MTIIENYRHQIYSCKRCASCIKWSWYDSQLPGFIEGITKKGFNICPVFEFTKGFESDSPRGKMILARGIVEKKIEIDKEIVERFYQCTGCGNCTEHCPQYRQGKLDPYEVIRVVRTGILELGHNPPKGVKLESRNKPRRWKIPESRIPSEMQAKTCNTGFFAGCFSSSRFQSIVHGLLGVLQKTGTHLRVLKDGLCCGSEQFSKGQLDLARSMAVQNLDTFANYGLDKLVVTCARCYQMFKNEYPKIVGKTIPIIHYSQLLEELLENKALRFEKVLKKTITYHDPCELGRRSGIYGPPRKIIKSIQGVNFVEMRENMENSWCCGGGGGVKFTYEELALKIAERRLGHALDVGAEMIVTACPICKLNLNDAAKRKGEDLEICDLAELVQGAI